MKDFSVRKYPKLVCQLQMFNRTEQNKSEGLYLLICLKIHRILNTRPRTLLDKQNCFLFTANC